MAAYGMASYGAVCNLIILHLYFLLQVLYGLGTNYQFTYTEKVANYNNIYNTRYFHRLC